MPGSGDFLSPLRNSRIGGKHLDNRAAYLVSKEVPWLLSVVVATAHQRASAGNMQVNEQIGLAKRVKVNQRARKAYVVE